MLMAAQLLGQSSDTTVQIFESTGKIGAGIAYSTQNPNHLLNVRAGNMSAFPNKPEDFLDWLRTNSRDVGEQGWQAQSFAPRGLYRHYLNALLAPYLDMNPPRVFIEAMQAVDIALIEGKPQVTSMSGEKFSAEALIIATGNETAIAASGEHVAEYWSSNGYFGIPADKPVAIFGTGLSMIDSVISLLDKGHRAEIHAISRRGLLPARHISAQPLSIAEKDLPIANGLPALARHIRALVGSSGDWRSIIDGLHPHMQHIWANLLPAEKQSFLQHLRPWWDVHRHRMAPATADRIEGARASGQLRITAAHLVAVHNKDRQVMVRYRKRRERTVEEIDVATIIDCRGGNPRFSTTRNPALISLMENGLARPDVTDLGLDISSDLQILDARGKTAGSLFALGPVTKGAFWEVTAIPDIRVQAQRLAQILLEE